MSNQSTPEVTRAIQDILLADPACFGRVTADSINAIAALVAPARGGDELREALEPFLRAAEPILHDDRARWNPDEWHNRLDHLTVGQFRALHAAALASTDMAGAGEKVEPWSNDPHGIASELRRVANGWAESFRLPQLLRDAADQIDTTAALASPPPVDRADAGESVWDSYRLPCDVHLAPATVIKAGCQLATLKVAMEVPHRPKHFDGHPNDAFKPAAQPLEGLTSGQVGADHRAHAIFDGWDKHPDAPAYWFHLRPWVQDYATECVAATERRLATSPKATATASVREEVAKIINPDAFRGSFLASEFERLGVGVSPKVEAYDKADRILASLTDSGTAATIGGERA